MSLRNDADFVTGVKTSKIIPKNTDGSTALPYPGKTEVVAFSGLGPFDFSGASAMTAVPMTIKNNTVTETKTVDVDAASASISAVTVTELIAAITTAAFTGVTASVDARGYGELLISGGDAETDYMQVYGECATISEFGYGYGLQFIQLDTQKSFPMIPTNVDDETIETVDSNGKKTKVITPGYRDGLTATLVDSAVDNELRALLTGGSWNPTTKEFVAPLDDAVRPLLSIETLSLKYLKATNQKGDYIGAKLTRAFNMSSKEDSSGTGDNNFQDMSYSFTGTPYTNPETSVRYGDSMTRDYTVAQYNALNYGDI